MLFVMLLVNNRLSAVKFLESQELYMDSKLHSRSAPLTPTLLEGQLHASIVDQKS